MQVSASKCTSIQVQLNIKIKNRQAQGSQSACSKTIKELYLKNKIPARGNSVLQRKLQDQEVQVASENHRRRRAVQVGFVSNMHVSLCLVLGLAGLDLDQIQSILNEINSTILENGFSS